ATLRDVLVPISLNGLTPEVRVAWMDAIPQYDEQMRRGAELALDAVTERPGWPYHAFLLGQLVYARDSRAFSSQLITGSGRWSVPLLRAAGAADSDDALWQSLALAYLQTWPDLSQIHAASAPTVLRKAFRDVTFVRSTFGPAMQIVGKNMAIACLSDAPGALWEAFQQIAMAGDIGTAWTLHQRWDAAEWRARRDDLLKIDRAAARGNIDETRWLCHVWTSMHSVWDYDSPEAHAQAGRLLDLWPVSDVGRWPTDNRAEVIRYFLAGRENTVDGAILAHSATALRGIPSSTQARLRVLAADISGADAIARSSESLGSFEWTPYLVDLARYWLRNGDPEKARAALATLPPAARNECDVRAVREAAGEVTHPADTNRIGLVWSEQADVPICLPKGVATTVKLVLLSSTPVVVDYGWDRARYGCVLLSRSGETVEVALPAVEGMHTLSVRTPFRPPASSLSVELVSGPI
ncbi:MAG TPA: hypothetical protein VF962_02315, partial [Gemmatimonadaceae bacterium]